MIVVLLLHFYEYAYRFYEYMRCNDIDEKWKTETILVIKICEEGCSIEKLFIEMEKRA